MGKTIEEINERIKRGEAVVVSAEEVMDLVRKEGVEETGARWTSSPPAPSAPLLLGSFRERRARPAAHEDIARLAQRRAGVLRHRRGRYIGATEMANTTR